MLKRIIKAFYGAETVVVETVEVVELKARRLLRFDKNQFQLMVYANFSKKMANLILKAADTCQLNVIVIQCWLCY